MITTGLIMLAGTLLPFLFQVFPTGSLPDGVSTSIGSVLGWIWVVNPILDVPTILDIFELFIVIELAMLAIEFVFWVYAKIPIIGKK